MSPLPTDPYHDLPEDPEAAFLRLEAHFKNECQQRLRETDSGDRTDVVYVDYIAQVLAAINALDLEAEFKTQVPSIEDVDYNTYLNFNKDVMHYCTMLKIRNGKRTQGYSVQFDETARRKIHHHLQQVQDIFDKLEVDEKKRAKLASRLSELQREVDQPRTRFDRLAALLIEASSVVGEVVDKTKILELLDSISRVFWGAQTEAQKQLPPPEKPKSIEPPKFTPREKKVSFDDDIPF